MSWVTAAAAHYREHGWAITQPLVPLGLCDDIKRAALDAARERCDHVDRTSITSFELNKEKPWWQLMQWAIAPGNPIALVLTRLFGDCWFIEKAGGDVIAPGAIFRARECGPHSDWKGVRNAMCAVSIIVHEVRGDEATWAPIILYSLATGEASPAIGEKGALVLRDVDVIHHGTANDTDQTRVLPCLRFMIPNALRAGYLPAPYIQPRAWKQFDDHTRAKFVYALIQESDKAKRPGTDDDTPPPRGGRYKTPSSMTFTFDPGSGDLAADPPPSPQGTPTGAAASVSSDVACAGAGAGGAVASVPDAPAAEPSVLGAQAAGSAPVAAAIRPQTQDIRRKYAPQAAVPASPDHTPPQPQVEDAGGSKPALSFGDLVAAANDGRSLASSAAVAPHAPSGPATAWCATALCHQGAAAQEDANRPAPDPREGYGHDRTHSGWWGAWTDAPQIADHRAAASASAAPPEPEQRRDDGWWGDRDDG